MAPKSIALRRKARTIINDNTTGCIDLDNVEFISRAVADELTHADVTVQNATGDVREMLLLVSGTDSLSEFNDKTG